MLLFVASEYLDNLSTYLLNEQGEKFSKSTTECFLTTTKPINNVQTVSDWQNFNLFG